MAMALRNNAQDEMEKIADLDVALWLPSAGSSPPHPLALFSHGYAGCNIQSAYIMRAFADNGYLVAAPNHADNQCGQPLNRRVLVEFIDKNPPASWTDDTFTDRRDELCRLRAALWEHLKFGPLIERKKTAL